MQVTPGIFKTYDIRGIWGKDLTPEIAKAIGKAYATFLQPKRIVCGHDVRNSSPALSEALMDGMSSGGVEVTDIGLVTSDALYFAVGKHGFDGGAMVTASHNPPEWNGVKLTRDRAIPIVGDENKTIGRIVERESFASVDGPGKRLSFDIAAQYIAQVLSFSTHEAGRSMKVVIDAGNGTVIPFLPAIMAKLPFAWEGMNMTPDGNFPGRNPNPLAEGALDGLQRRIVATTADVGVAFDADADRMFFLDEHGERVLGDVLTALLAKQFLRQHPGSTIVYNLISSHMVPEEILKAGGKPIRSAVGHAHMKPAMRQRQAVFGGEISGHYFFRDHYYADSGLIAMVVGLSYLNQQDKPLSELVREIDVYAHTAEVNSAVEDIPGTLAKIKAAYQGGQLDETDGVTVEYRDWWFNVRPSNTEPLLRLSVEAKTPAEMERRRDEILRIIRG
ncbi:MAG: phosphomannomutase/phosphoglucomutase [Candidatus Kerfeldbacteria bacterium]|nr:phosphomannomutase/phosphoglucomutase [Candidatus Kerfeldbacteria bacterium]